MASKRSKAAKKGWERRRARELARRLAALKGWQTRRGKQPSSKKSSDGHYPSSKKSLSPKKRLEQLKTNQTEKVFHRLMGFFPQANRRTVRAGVRMMKDDLELLLWATAASKSQVRARAGNKAYEQDGYNPFWYH